MKKLAAFLLLVLLPYRTEAQNVHCVGPGCSQPKGTLGTRAAAVSSSTESLDVWKRTTLTVDSGNVVLADGDHGAGVLLYTWPAGSTFVIGIVFKGTVTNTANFNADPNDTFHFALGTTAAADDATLATTESSLCGGTGGNPATVDTTGGTVTTRTVNIARARCDSFCATYVGAAGTAGTLYLNFAVAGTANSGSNTFRATGTVEITWFRMTDIP